MRTLMLVAALAGLTAPAFAQDSGGKVYKQAVSSVVWVHSARARGLATGSGSLIDRERRLVLTNYHVVEDNATATVFFPTFRDGQPIAEKAYYKDRLARLAHRGKVIATDKQADLAIIQLESVPEDVEALSLAAGSPSPGDTVHSIGNTGRSGALWGYVKGTVRQVYRKKWKAQLEPRRTIAFEAKVIETDSPTNPGDSGGPLLNDKGELIGVTQGGATDAQLVSFFVDISEVKQLLARDEVKRLKGEKAAKRTTPLPVTDGAKLFSPEAIKKAEQTVAELYKNKLDLLIETHAAAPDDVKKRPLFTKKEERQLIFREWAESRLAAQKARGVMILVCQDPRYVVVEIDDPVQDQFPEKYAQVVADALLKGLRDKKSDEGLAEALKLIREGYKGAKK